MKVQGTASSSEHHTWSEVPRNLLRYKSPPWSAPPNGVALAFEVPLSCPEGRAQKEHIPLHLASNVYKRRCHSSVVGPKAVLLSREAKKEKAKVGFD